MQNTETEIPFALPLTGIEEEEAILRVLRSGWLTTGAEAIAFEKEFAAFLQNPGIRCLAVNSATSGLHLALEACGVGPGDVVFVPSYTFTATAEVVRYLGADPVFVDVAPGTFHIDPQALEKALKQQHRGKPKAVIPVHYGGLSCDMNAIMDIARRYDLKVIEDAAHAFPSVVGTTFAGTIGDAGVFSFYATKTITTGEGGMVVCRDEAIARRISIMRSHGIDRTIWNRYTDTTASWYYEVVEAGYKYNLPDLLAALGRAQLGRAWELLAMRQAIAAAYDTAFGTNDCFLLPPTGPGDARHLYPLRLNPQRIGISRDEFIQKLKENGIGISVHFIPLHIMPFYKNRYGLAENDFPETIKSYQQEISLPIWPGMSEAQISRVIAVVQSIASVAG
ncbi:MAG: DegT/DnrJ/EryC1/StrS family aminotransferase [Treponema sp.]|jgi:dTDP-4-amino-4,6-dideoxygalactose transaminase|nr:DegT/DnrJ/EryC1/StrS family aminotransferase [Treponema sp.]